MTVALLALSALFQVATAEPVATPRGSLAPNYRPFRVDVGMGWATIPSRGVGGFDMTFEPKANLYDQFSLGFRADLAFHQGGTVAGDVEIRQQFIAAGLVKADYFLTTSAIRPWVSLAFGRYSVNGQQTTSGPASVEYIGGSFYGLSPQVGLELGVLRISATYNHLFGARIVVVDNVGGQPRTERYAQHYASIEVGLRLGGGRYR